MLAAFLVAMVSLIFAWELRFQRRVEAPMSLALTATRRSTEINRLLGAPLRASRIAKGRCVCDGLNGTADLTFQNQGPLSRGTIIEWAQEDTGRWKVCGLEFKMSDNSKAITLVDETFTHCERE
jgi:hypothetical protein